MVVLHGEAQLLEVVDALGTPGGFMRDWTAGSSRAMSTAMMAITTSSSINVKARRRCISDQLP